jgi:CheY-like chemotaxis protein
MNIDISGAKIIVVDDNNVNCSILLEQFEAWNLDGTSAASGSEKLAIPAIDQR